MPDAGTQGLFFLPEQHTEVVWTFEPVDLVIRLVLLAALIALVVWQVRRRRRP